MCVLYPFIGRPEYTKLFLSILSTTLLLLLRVHSSWYYIFDWVFGAFDMRRPQSNRFRYMNTNKTWICFSLLFLLFKKKNRKRNHKNIPSLHKIAVLLLLFAISTRTLLSIWKRKKLFFFFQSNRSVDSTFTFMWTQFVNFTVRMTTIITSRWIYK